jgi:hypothetical protein
MTAPTMEEWLNMFNSNMKKGNRKWCGRQFGGDEGKHCCNIQCQGNELSCDTKDFVWSDYHLATHYSFGPATALLTLWS